MRIEDVCKKMESLDVLIEDITLTSEEVKEQNEELIEIQRAFDAQYDW